MLVRGSDGSPSRLGTSVSFERNCDLVWKKGSIPFVTRRNNTMIDQDFIKWFNEHKILKQKKIDAENSKREFDELVQHGVKIENEMIAIIANQT